MTNEEITTDQAVIEGVDLLLQRCGHLRPGEKVAIICDKTTRALGNFLEERAKRLTPFVALIEIPPLAMHGQEPPSEAAEAMQRSALCLGITSKSMAHTHARQKAATKGNRYLSLPEYSFKLFADPSLRADYEARGILARFVADAFTHGTTVVVTSAAGTQLTMKIDGRIGNCCPGYVQGPGELGSPPDIEANVSPIETSSEGVVVVDGSIPYPTIGLLKQPVILTVKGGRIVDIEGNPQIVQELRRLFDSAASPKAYILAECGVGLNNHASLTGVMLTDEGTAGTMHFGFGSNSTVGGMNDVAFHLDFVFRRPSMKVDDITVLREGELRFPQTVGHAPFGETQ